MTDSFAERTFTLAASAARTADGTGTAVETNGKSVIYMVVCEFTDKKTDASDKMDVFVDVLVGSLWVNAIHFTQALGNGTDAQKEYACLIPGSNPTAAGSVADFSSDLTSGKVRHDAFGSSMRARWDFTDGGDGGVASFTFSVIAYAL